MASHHKIALDKDTLVAPRFRIIPNGIDGDRLRGTLLISLVPGSYYALEAWPSGAAELIRTPVGKADGTLKLSVRLEPTPRSEESAAVVRALNVRLAAPALAKAMDNGKQSLVDLWASSLVGKLEGEAAKPVWEHLLRTLDQVQSGSALDANLKPTPAKSAEFGDRGQLSPTAAMQTRTCEAVLSTRYSDAALVLDRRRGRALAESLKCRGERDCLPEKVPDLGEAAPPVRKMEDVEEDERSRIRNEKDFLKKIHLLAEFIDIQDVSGASTSALLKAKEEYGKRLQEILNEIGDPLGQPDAWAEATRDPDFIKAALAANTDAQLKRRKMARWNQLRNTALKGAYKEAEKQYNDAKNAIRSSEAQQVCRLTKNEVSPEDDAELLGHVRAASEYGSWSEHQDEPEDSGRVLSTAEILSGQLTKNKERAGLAFFSIEGNPSLARVFGLAFDIVAEFEPGVLGKHDYAAVCALPEDAEPDARTIWTRTKLRTSDGGKQHGWPCTMGEYLLWKQGGTCLSADAIGQFEGVMTMGGVASAGGAAGLPRFDITSLDVGAALEAERSWLQAIEAQEGDTNRNDAQWHAVCEALSVGPDYQSNGLTLLCRSAVSDAIRKLAALKAKICDPKAVSAGGTCVPSDLQIHDAEDLTNGYRLIVGVPDAANGSNPGRWGTEWRPLMGRTTRFGTSGKPAQIVEELLALIPNRAELDGAQLAIPARELATSGTTVETIVDETFAQWDGTPLGVACGKVPGEPETQPDSNCFGRTFNLLTNGLRPVHLRNGRPYRFGLQVVFSGGRAVPLEELPLEWTGVVAELTF
ncbi:hypothetical protein [Paracoccus yeei]|uniref:Uncharacterized protein n=1 Tax=Paracoccus yeei TaxID=147645 RepID=A0A2D2C201_9RHOB|nr:hypothetical protein [Paracoccus yeei]ATQ56517.1 hypothetical protein PYTT13_12415 [Paracoccus yeei]